MKNNITFLCFFLISVAVFGQSTFEKNILGTWDFKKVRAAKLQTHKDSVKVVHNPFGQKGVQLTFASENNIILSVADFKLHATYRIENEILTIGKYSYDIIAADALKLILRMREDELKQTYIYHRIREQ